MCQKPTHTTQQNLLLNHLVGAREDRLRNGQPRRFGGREIDAEIELGRLLDRPASRLRAAQLTSASISGCGLSLSEQDNQSASLASASILQVTIARS